MCSRILLTAIMALAFATAPQSVRAQTEKPVGIAQTMRFLPDNANAFLSIDLSKSKVFRDLRDAAAKDKNGQSGANFLGVPADRIDQFTFGVVWTEKGNDLSAAVSLHRPTTLAEIKARKKGFFLWEIVGHKEIKAGQFTICQEIVRTMPIFGSKPGPEEEGPAYCLVQDKLAVYGKLSELKKVLDRSAKPALTRNVQTAVAAIGKKNSLTAVLDLESMPEARRKELLRDLAGQGQFAEAVRAAAGRWKYLAVALREDGNATGTVQLVCQDAASAATTKKAVDDVLTHLRNTVKDDPMAKAETRKAAGEMRALLNAVRVSVKDDTVRMEFDVEPGVLLRGLLAIRPLQEAKGGARGK